MKPLRNGWKHGNIRGRIVCELRKKIKLIVEQNLNPLFENFDSLIKSVKETYALPGHEVLKGELPWKTKIINTLLKTIEQFGNDKRNIQPVPLLSFENDFIISKNVAQNGIKEKVLIPQQMLLLRNNLMSLKEKRNRNITVGTN